MESNKSKPTTLIVVASLVVLLGIGAAAYALLQPATNGEPAEKTTTKSTESVPSSSSSKVESDNSSLPTIVFTDEGFSQPTYTFPAGRAIKVDNQSSMDMQFSSDDHPTHRNHTELNMSVLGAGESGTFTPAGKGTYKFHDHINDQFDGTLVIE